MWYLLQFANGRRSVVNSPFRPDGDELLYSNKYGDFRGKIDGGSYRVLYESESQDDVIEFWMDISKNNEERQRDVDFQTGMLDDPDTGEK